MITVQIEENVYHGKIAVSFTMDRHVWKDALYRLCKKYGSLAKGGKAGVDPRNLAGVLEVVATAIKLDWAERGCGNTVVEVDVEVIDGTPALPAG
jgi:hypothetical protein